MSLNTTMSTPLNPATLQALAAFPQLLEDHYSAFPREFVHWSPCSWDGVPSEPFTAIEQICHVRDIEIEGYHQRFTRTLNEDQPLLPAQTLLGGEVLPQAGRFHRPDDPRARTP